MKSHPLIESVLIFFLFAGIGIPLWYLTADRTKTEESDVPIAQGSDLPTASIPAFVRFQFSSPPARCTLMTPDKKGVWSWENTRGISDFETTIELPVEHHQLASLLLTVFYPSQESGSDTPNRAVFVQFEPEGMDSFKQTFWINAAPQLIRFSSH